MDLKILTRLDTLPEHTAQTVGGVFGFEILGTEDSDARHYLVKHLDLNANLGPFVRLSLVVSKKNSGTVLSLDYPDDALPLRADLEVLFGAHRELIMPTDHEIAKLKCDPECCDGQDAESRFVYDRPSGVVELRSAYHADQATVDDRVNSIAFHRVSATRK